jgi:hypothetical protein
MRVHRRLLLSALLSGLALVTIASQAAGRRIEVTQQQVKAVWTSAEPIIFELEAGMRMSCPVTLEGSFHSRTLSKVADELIGYVRRFTLNSSTCRRQGLESISVLAETLPWHIQYRGFQGTLPNITGINYEIVGSSFQVTQSGLMCLYRGTEALPWILIGVIAIGVILIVAATAETIPKNSGGFLCPEGMGFGGGRARLTGPEGTTAVSVRLVQ